MPQPLVVLTGASGFIGRSVTRRFLAHGFRVRALVRSPEAFRHTAGMDADAVDAVAWTLGQPAPAGTFDDAVAMVHLACATRGEPAALFALNVNGTQVLLDSAAGTQVFRVFVSSFSAGPAGDAGLHRRSAYSAAKQRAETSFDRSRDLIVRPGLVVGSGDHGLFARMRAQLQRGVPMPLFYGGRTPVQWIHVDDLADALVHGVEQRRTGVFSLASPEAVSLEAWTRAVASALGLPVRMVRIPDAVSDAGAWALRAVERLGLRLPIGSDTVFGIKYARSVETKADLERLGVVVDGLRDTLERAR